MKYVSLFAGIGGFDLALNSLGHECVYANEWDKYAAITYRKNFKRRHKLSTRDISIIKSSEIPDHHLIVAGFPCQSFSIAGKRGGFNDTRGTMFFEIARILKNKRPPYLLLENVKGLLSHDNGRTFETIMRTLDELGYDTQWQVCNSKDFGVPQNRERVFIVGNIRGISRPKVFPFKSDERMVIRKKDPSIANTITANYWKGPAASRPLIGTYRTHKDGKGFREMKMGISPTIPARAREDGSGQPVVAIPVMSPDRPNKKQNGRRFKENGDPSFTLTEQDRHGVLMCPHGTNPGGVKKLPNLRAHSGAIHNEIILPDIRRLTPLECERLQGFPDNWTAGVSDTQRYKQLGNAVTVNVVYEIMRRFV